MMAEKANYSSYDKEDYLRFLGEKARLARKTMSGIDSADDEDTLIYRNDMFAKQGFFYRIMVFDAMKKNTYYEVLLVTPSHSKTFYGDDLGDMEFDVLYFLKRIRTELDMPR